MAQKLTNNRIRLGGHTLEINNKRILKKVLNIKLRRKHLRSRWEQEDMKVDKDRWKNVGRN
jgi:hypothetical protein